MAIHPGLRRRRRIGPHVTGIAVRQIHDEEVRLPLDPADDHDGLAEVRLGMSGRMRQRHEHLPPAAFALAHVILHDRVAAGEPVLVPEPLQHAPGRMALLAVDPDIALQPAVDDLGEPVQLRPLHRRRSPIAGRNRERHHLANAVARDVEMPGRLSLAHAFRTGQTNLPIHVHGENPPALPAVFRKDKGGRLFRRPQQGDPAATVADFCTAVPTRR